MITKLNLSTHPFRNRNLPYLLAVFMLGLSVAGALYCFAVLRQNSLHDREARIEIAELESRIKDLKDKGEQIQQQLSPEQQNLLIAANKLVSNKDFIWSRLFSDLEAVLPGSVSASRISVKNVYSEGGQLRADLDFAVLAGGYDSVREMIDRMNNSGLFHAELRGQDLQKTDRMTFTEYSLHLAYTPTYRISSAPGTDVAQNVPGGGQ